jgi:RNA polymerase sigma factor (sigma-70 family)
MTDGQLLECFVARRDEAAFAALVRRHGPMVLGVCRRVLHHAQDAEDAFQAAFLVLARKAASIRQRELLGNWLYGVAYRTALDARSAAVRRQGRERQVSAMPEPVADDGADVWRDLRPLLDQELNRLPDKYRVPVVLCDLEGRTRRHVARQLGIPEGTLSGRLTTARRILARRLARHGLALSTAVLTEALGRGAAAGVPAELIASTVRIATRVAGAAVVSARVAALAEGAVRAMLVTKLKTATALLLLVGLVVGAGLLAHPPSTAEPPAGKTAEKPPAALREVQDRVSVGPPRVLKLDDRGRRVVWSPDGKTLVVVTKVEKAIFGFQYNRKGSAIELWDVERGERRQFLARDPDGGLAFQQVVFSADGKRIAATVSEEVRKPDVCLIRLVVKVWDARTAALKHTLGEDDSNLVCLALSPDGKRVAAGDPRNKTVTLWNAETGKLERTLATGETQPWSVAFAPDGKTLVVGGQPKDHPGEATLWDVETGKAKQTLKANGWVNSVVFSPDGKVVAVGGGGDAVALWDVENGKPLHSLKGHAGGTHGVAISPDGRTVAAGGRDGKILLWDVQTGNMKQTLKGHNAEVYSVAFSADGKTLASTGQDKTVRLWPTGQPAAEKK